MESKYDLSRVEKELESKINQAKEKILSLEEDFDEEGSKPYKEETLNRALEFYKNLSIRLFEKFNSLKIIPKILPGPDQGIDLLWKNDDFQLLIHIPEDPKDVAYYYGDNYQDNKSKGTFKLTEEEQVIIYWLTNFLIGK